MTRFREVETYENGRRQYRRIELPTIVCLCGSRRFYEEYQRVAYKETMEGKIVLSGPAYDKQPAWPLQYREMLDELQRKKIDLADEVFVLNCDGYVGESTMDGIAYALWRRKELRWLEEPVGGTDAWVLNHKKELGKLIAKHSGMMPRDGEEKTITLDTDIEGLGKAGEQVPLSKMMEWGATEGFKLGYHKGQEQLQEAAMFISTCAAYIPFVQGDAPSMSPGLVFFQESVEGFEAMKTTLPDHAETFQRAIDFYNVLIEKAPGPRGSLHRRGGEMFEDLEPLGELHGALLDIVDELGGVPEEEDETGYPEQDDG